MAAAITDKFKKGYGFFSTTLSAQKNSGASSMSLSDATGVPTTTGLVFTVGRVNSSGTSTPSTRAIYKGTLSGTTVSNLTLTEGTDQTHAAGTVVEITFTATHWNDAIDGVLVEHEQDGTHKAITTPSIVIDDAGTLDVDTINEATAAAGVTIDGMQIKDNLVVGASGKGVDNTSLNTAAGKLGAAWQSWTPTFTNMSGGTLNYAKYHQIGKTIHFRLKYTLAGAGISGSVSFTPPVTANAEVTTELPVSSGVYLIDNAAQNYDGTLLALTTTSFTIRVRVASGTYVTQSTALSSTVPFTWGANDHMYITGTYEAE